MNKNYELELPQNYDLIYHLDARNKKVGIIFTVVSLVVLLVVMGVAVIPLIGNFNVELTDVKYLYAYLVFMLVMCVYIVLHELVHGIAYYGLTKQKLTFGLTWSCAFCGVPNIYCYRKTALIALVSPLIVFTLVFVPLTIWLYFIDPIYYLMAAFVLGLHLGGCCGDIFMTYLLLTRFKNKKTLIKDTGPAQFVYLERVED
jgi:hypothetical protein